MAQPVCCEALDGKSRTDGEGEVVAECEESRRRGRGILRIGSARSRGPERDPSSQPHRIHSRAQSLDDASGLVARNPGEPRGIIDAATALGVREIHADGVEADQHLAGAGLGSGMSAERQDLGAA
jgi:hypothetical protein